MTLSLDEKAKLNELRKYMADHEAKIKELQKLEAANLAEEVRIQNRNELIYGRNPNQSCYINSNNGLYKVTTNELSYVNSIERITSEHLEGSDVNSRIELSGLDDWTYRNLKAGIYDDAPTNKYLNVLLDDQRIENMDYVKNIGKYEMNDKNISQVLNAMKFDGIVNRPNGDTE
ncbi:hypothetical protein FO497_13490 [Bacillus cereus ATCC 10876]|uniref:hypothetical protein n=1 Tax=Bacillus TaxID=1386 RepID=UPI00019FF2A3|nr:MULTISPECIES: hypothetical protein [Bacillus]MDJ0280707.1 hypothetical protein [Bacillus bombysepticus]EEK47961.1 hypothetical protein bcere0002_50220 [Bacillus cereus ATCC 10876]KFL78959.1 hypothetical protein DJ50_5368 [Bacillus cereus ATCC 10876]MBG9866020.1 hypothetical protein [Bacillus cereus]MBO1128290.1 hypothetical protein [Bacillus cereus]